MRLKEFEVPITLIFVIVLVPPAWAQQKHVMQNRVEAVFRSGWGLASAAGSQSVPKHPTTREPSITEIVKASSPAVVLVATFDGSGNAVAQGSGFIISGDGKVITNYHVIEGADSSIVKMGNGAYFPVEGVLAQSKSDDLVVLKVSGSGLPVLHLGEAKSVSSGERVIAIGSPLGLEGTVTDGIVSAIREDEETNTPLIQTTAPISHGSSGGPLLDLAGRVVGVLTFMFGSGENLNFAVAVDALKDLLATEHAPTPLANLRHSAPESRQAEVGKPEQIDPGLQARQAQARQHAGRGNKFLGNLQYADAEAEYRAGLRLDPQNADLHMGLGGALVGKGELDGAITELREAVRLDPNHMAAHALLGAALEKKGDWDGSTAEYEEALRLEPEDAYLYLALGGVMRLKGDWDGEIAAYREALRHDPKNDTAHENLGSALAMKGDWDGAIAEEREALRLNPKNEDARVNLGVALERQGDWDGDIAEQREVLRLNPNNDSAHYHLGVALERKGDAQGALREYRAAYELNPRDPDHRRAYERLVQQVNR
jgi:S1-C subfamily serine protease/Flp pilus assembly protein TadD